MLLKSPYNFKNRVDVHGAVPAEPCPRHAWCPRGRFPQRSTLRLCSSSRFLRKTRGKQRNRGCTVGAGTPLNKNKKTIDSIYIYSKLHTRAAASPTACPHPQAVQENMRGHESQHRYERQACLAISRNPQAWPELRALARHFE